MFKFNLKKLAVVSASALVLLGVGAVSGATTTNANACSKYVPAWVYKNVAKQDADAGDQNDGKLGQSGKSKMYTKKYITVGGHTYRAFTNKEMQEHRAHVSHGHAYLAPAKKTVKKVHHLRKAHKHVAKKIAHKKATKKHIRKHVAKKSKRETKEDRIQKQINRLNREIKVINKQIAKLDAQCK